MKTFLNLCKKPLLYVSAALFVIFTALLVVSFLTPLGKTYSYTTSMEDEGINFKLKAEITFTSDKEYSSSIKVLNVDDIKEQAKESGEEVSDEEIEEYIKQMEESMSSEKLSYVVEDGKIYSVINIPSVGEQKIELGEKKGYKIVSAQKDADGNTVSYVCTANKTVQVASIVLMVVSGVALAGCVVVLVLDKKGIIGGSESEAVAE